VQSVVPAESSQEDEADTTYESSLININKASKMELEALPGIGPVTAQKIIDYRIKYGEFRSKEEILKVSGIGPKKFDAIKDKITIK